MEWMVLGQKMSEGNTLYTEIWTSVAPLSAFVYWLVNLFMGQEQFAYELTAYLFIIFQAVYLSIITNRREFFLERNYVVGAVYVLLANLSFDLGKLSPALMGTTFLIIAYNSFAKQIGNRDGVRDDVFEVGLFVGVATLFHLPFMAFLPWITLAMLLFTGASFRQILLIVLGFVLPIFVMGIYFYFVSDFEAFKYSVLESSIRFTQLSFGKLIEVFYTFTIPLLVSLVGYFFLITNSRYNGGQSRMHQIALLGVLFGVVAYFLSPYKIPMQLYGTLPFMAIFIAGFFLHMKGTYLPEVAFIMLLLITLFVQYQGVKPLIGKGFNHLEEVRLSKQIPPDIIKGKKMLIIGERIDEYKYGKQVTAYLNWNLSKRDLAEPNDYESVVNIFDNFRKEPPEVIIDKKGVIPTIFKRIPELAKDYKSSKIEGIYLRK
ncbi:MAG: hypothetical protein ACI9V1_001469 [Spirosomataceae bacterium]|jgi:hypothetical protein